MAKSMEKIVLHGVGKLDGKTRTWVVAVFNDMTQAKPFAALLKVAYGAGDTKALEAMDIHAPKSADGKFPTEVKFSASKAQYTPEPVGLDDDLSLG